MVQERRSHAGLVRAVAARWQQAPRARRADMRNRQARVGTEERAVGCNCRHPVLRAERARWRGRTDGRGPAGMNGRARHDP